MCSGLHEFLKMTVAIPLLNGIPPQHEYLRYICPYTCSLKTFLKAGDERLSEAEE